MNFLKYIPLVISIFLSLNAFTQEFLTKRDAIELALKNNYDILIVKNNTEIAQNNVSLKNNDYLPSLTGNAGANYNNNDIDVTFNNGTSNVLKNAESESYNASINLDYIIFDGLGRRYNFKKLKETYSLSELQARATIENTIIELFGAYYQVARLIENKRTLQNTLEISKSRLERLNVQAEYGQTVKLEVLNAEVDANNDSINLLNIAQELNNSKHNLNLILGREITIDFDVDTLLQFKDILSRESLYNQFKENNVQLLQTQTNLNLLEYDLAINKTSYIPSIGINGAYGWNKNNNNSSSFVETQTSNGISAGLTLRWNIFDGGKTSVQNQNTKIQIENQKISKTQIEEQLKRDFENTWGNYQNKLYVLTVREQNLSTFQRNFNKTQEQFLLGQITSLDFRQAQLNLLNARLSKNSAKYEAKVAEIQLMQLSGNLLEVDFN